MPPTLRTMTVNFDITTKYTVEKGKRCFTCGVKLDFPFSL